MHFRTSASGCAAAYENLAESAPHYQDLKNYEWQFGSTLRIEHVWDGFTILSLLEDYRTRSTILEVPDTGDQEYRFSEAVRERNLRIQIMGQPATMHYCNICTRWYEPENDGESLGMWQVLFSEYLFIPVYYSQGVLCCCGWCYHRASMLRSSQLPDSISQPTTPLLSNT